jgi:DNA (cytosine-5)-methyltransferase 1
MNQYTGGGQSSDIEKPCPAIATVPKQNLMTVKPWIMDTNYNNVGSSIEQPAQVVTANRKWHYLMNPQFTSAGGSIDRPCFTLIARMDKMPPYLVDISTHGNSMPSFIVECDEGIVYQIYDNDSEILVKIKEFMALYGIIDIKMRMLRIPELKKIMGFPSDYILIGTQADQKKFIGNAVEVHMATALVEATAKGLKEKLIAA